MALNIILGYVFTVVNYGMYCFSRFCKTKNQMLLLDLFSKIACIAGLYFLGSLSGAYSFLANFGWLIFANIKERKNKKWPVIYVLFQVILVIILITTYDGLSSITVFIALSITLLATWWLSPQLIRSTGLLVSASILVYQFSILNWAGLVCEMIVVISNIISYLQNRKKA